jgi:predicted nucleic acid-binding protein
VLLTTPHIYVDTNILVGALEDKDNDASRLLDLMVRKGWKCSTSIFAFMEMLDVNQDNRYVLNQLQLGVHIKKAYKSLDQRNLSAEDLKSVNVNIMETFSWKYPNITYYQYGQQNWDTAVHLKTTTNLSAADVIHLATAIEAGCDLLVTMDSFFRKEAANFIKSCLPAQTEKSLKAIGFQI